MRLIALAKTAALLTVCSFAQPGHAEISAEEAEAVLRVDMAGRQRMLSQRMVKSACLMALDIDVTSAFDQMTQAYELFVRSDHALRHGDDAIGLSPETYAPVTEAQQRTEAPWTVYRLVIENGIESAEISSAELSALDSAGLTLLRELNATVFATAQAHAAAAPKVSLGLTVTVDVAGRQRMLSQRAIKEACLLNGSASPEEQAERLLATIDLFDRSLSALIEGHSSAGILPPPNQEVARKLAEVAELWRPIRQVLTNAANEKEMSSRDLGRLALDGEPLLRTMNEAVGLYGL